MLVTSNTKTELPLISVVVPTYNRSELLGRAISSILGQTYRNLECIVVDDASGDDTEQVVSRFREKDPRVILLRHNENRHVSAARNAGIDQARGDFVAFLDDDDEWFPGKLEKQVTYFQGLSKSVGMIYCWMDYYNEQGEKVLEHHPIYRGNIFPHVLDEQRIGGCPTLLVRKKIAKKIGGFDENLRRGNDGDFIRRVSLECEVDFVPEVLVRVHCGHAYDNITRDDTTGICNAIRGQEIKLVKFKDKLQDYPKQTANIYANMAFNYSMLGDWRKSAAFYWKALRKDPLSKHVGSYIFQGLRRGIARV